MTGRAPLFVTRKFPPSVGGMETLSAGVWRSIVAVRPDARLLAHGGSNRHLVWWFPITVVRLVRLIVRGRVEVILTGDALTHAVVAPFARLLGVRCATMIMGLDLTYQNPLYRAVVLPWLRRAPQVVAISTATAGQARQAGVRADRVVVVRLGVADQPVPAEVRAAARTALRDRLGLADDAVVLATLGRLVRRKGARWFTTEVLGRLPERVHYVVAGDGPEMAPLVAAVAERGLGDRVHLLGRVDDALRSEVMAGADVFVQPNVAVPGDMEGFGLVTVEAAMAGTLVVAADLEGISDAVIDGVTGILLPSGDTEVWVGRLGELIADPAARDEAARAYARAAASHFDEASMGEALCALLGIAGTP